MDEIREYVRERDEALFSLDRPTIEAFFRKYGNDYIAEQDEIIFWGTVYVAICHITTAPPELVETAEKWLAEHNMSSDLDRIFGTR